MTKYEAFGRAFSIFIESEDFPTDDKETVGRLSIVLYGVIDAMYHENMEVVNKEVKHDKR